METGTAAPWRGEAAPEPDREASFGTVPALSPTTGTLKTGTTAAVRNREKRENMATHPTPPMQTGTSGVARRFRAKHNKFT